MSEKEEKEEKQEARDRAKKKKKRGTREEKRVRVGSQSSRFASLSRKYIYTHIQIYILYLKGKRGAAHSRESTLSVHSHTRHMFLTFNLSSYHIVSSESNRAITDRVTCDPNDNSTIDGPYPQLARLAPVAAYSMGPSRRVFSPRV